MTGRIIFMTEEPSMGQTLRHILPKVCPDFREFEHWLILNHQGRSDLEQSFPRKMRHWQEPGIKFIILRDNDGSNCRDLKQRLVSMAPPDAHEFQVHFETHFETLRKLVERVCRQTTRSFVESMLGGWGNVNRAKGGCGLRRVMWGTSLCCAGMALGGALAYFDE
jgi:hypothetical protein